MKINKRKYLIIYLSIFLIFLIVKTVFISRFYDQGKYISDTTNIAGDASHYLEIGENIHLFNVYSDDYSGFPTEKATWRPPVWPYVLAIFYKISDSFFVFIILKTFLVTGLLMVCIHYFVRYFRKTNLFVFFPILIILEPQFHFYSLTFLTEDLTAVFVLLYFLLYIKYISTKLNSIIFGILSALLLLTHPITLFLIISIFTVLFLNHFKDNKLNVFLIGFSFVLLTLIWPVRNYFTFHRGLYLTTSQGIVLAKSWNDSIVNNFNNVDGDMADPRINLKYINFQGYKKYTGDINESKLYKDATFKFIKSKSFTVLFKISLKKIKSNFNPLPEKRQEMALNKLAIPFRVVYLLLFIQSIYLLLFKRNIIPESKLKAVYFVIAIICAQLLTSFFFYTGLRFNVIYSLTLALIFLILNSENIKNLCLKIKSQC